MYVLEYKSLYIPREELTKKTERSKATGGSSTLCVRNAGHWNKLRPRRKGRRSGELSHLPEAWNRRVDNG